ncbi:MAG: tetratricopeptide repeat protein [Fermentimonas sp.]
MRIKVIVFLFFVFSIDTAIFGQSIDRADSLLRIGKYKEAEEELLAASKKRITESYFKLGELYTKMYRFEEANKEFDKFERVNRRKKDELARLDDALDYLSRLERSVSRTEDIQIIDSIVLSKESFLDAYNLSRSSGSIMPVRDFFKDINASGNGTLYMNEKGDKVYYSHEVDSSNNNLYTMDKLIDSFGNEKRFPENISSDGSQAYPFVMNDGLTIYFASTGHNTFGGYDIFVTRYNLASDSYLTPNQLNMPFNSPFNDYMMVIDEEKSVGWFASDRYQPIDSVVVYTFIPNEVVSLVETDDEAYKANRAKISSIKDTWKEGVDYSRINTVAKQRDSKDKVNDRDFSFVINDMITYHSLNDFRDSNARSIFNRSLDLERQLTDMVVDLGHERERFANDGGNNSSLRVRILELERQVESLKAEVEKLKLQARNEEIKSNYSF